MFVLLVPIKLRIFPSDPVSWDDFYCFQYNGKEFLKNGATIKDFISFVNLAGLIVKSYFCNHQN